MKKKKNEKKVTKKKKISWFTIFCGFADICVIAFFIVVYGPTNFKHWWITTALETGHHKYFANVLYSDKEIETIYRANIIDEVDEVTNVDEWGVRKLAFKIKKKYTEGYYIVINFKADNKEPLIVVKKQHLNRNMNVKY